MNIDDPRLTAFALGELDEPERSTVARVITESPEAQRFVDETRELASALKKEFAAELKTEKPVSANLIDIRDDPWLWSIARPLAIAAVIAVCALITGVAIFSTQHQKEIATARLPAAHPVEAEVESVGEPSSPVLAQTTPPAQPEFHEDASEPAKWARQFGIKAPSAGPLAKGKPGSSRSVDIAQQSYARRDLATYRQNFNTAAYDHIVENPFLDASSNPLSTFSIDVDTASYSNIRRFINEGSLPPKDAVRVEEMINYFIYDYAQPTDEKPFAVHVDVAGCPWEVPHRLVRIGLKGKEIATDKRGPSNLVFLLDVSGSMMPPERLPLVKQAMRLLVEKLTENDRVVIVFMRVRRDWCCRQRPAITRNKFSKRWKTCRPADRQTALRESSWPTKLRRPISSRGV